MSEVRGVSSGICVVACCPTILTIGSCARAAFMEIRQAIGDARPEMDKRAGRLAGHASVAISGAVTTPSNKARIERNLRVAVERGHEMHFRSAWVGETDFDATGNQGTN